MKSPLEQEIISLKQERGALLLAHYYQEGDLQDVADAVGDSLFLAQTGQKCDAPVVLLAGVVFMAESVKLLSPEKTVLAPDMKAGCSLVESAPPEKYRQWRHAHPEAICISYINSSTEVKALSDVICTSSNAEKIIWAIPPDRPILFGPDRHLGNFLSKKTGRPMHLWPGACEVHVLFSARRLFELKAEHPDAIVLAHPECDEVVLEQAQIIGSTSRLLEEVAKNSAKKFIVATEDGIFHQMKKARPDAVFLQAPTEGSCGCNQCPYMKLNTLEKVRNALRDLQPAIQVESVLIEEARKPLQRMMDLTAGKRVEWPGRFSLH